MKYTYQEIEKINNSIPIVEYASKYLELIQDKGKRSNEYWCVCPFHDDINASMSFNSDKNVYKCMGCDNKGSLINFVMQYHKLTFPQAIEHVLQLVDISFENKEYSEVIDYLNKNKSKKVNENIITHTYLPEDIIEQYTKEPIKEWLNEGISQNILDKYQVRYNKSGNAIIFPIRDIEGRILAIKARTLYKNYKDLGISKYKYYQSIGTNDFLFGLYQNIKKIKEKNEVIVLEGAKGVFLAESYGYDNCVSLETNTINELQMNLLLQLQVDVVLCLDKGIEICTNKKAKAKNNLNTYVDIGLLPKLTNVYIIKDTENLLENKDCPADKGKEIFDRLYERRFKFNE